MEEKGLTPESKITDAPISIPIEGTSNVWTPKNSNNKYSNEELTLKQGLAQSVNTISAQLMKMVGPDSVVAFAKRLGIQSPLDPTYSLCLGTGDVSLIEMVNAYAVFIDEGVWHQPIIITRIEDKYGNVLEEFSESSNIVMNEQTASYMIDLLKGSVEEEGGTSVDLVRKYAIKGEVGGKTGTTQNSSDGWFIGVAPNLVTGVWVGGERRVIRFPSMMYGQGAKMSLPTWAYYMQQVQAHPEVGYPASVFKQLTDTTSHSRSIDQLDGVDTVAVPSNRFSLDIYQ
jgi:penicillin-binding protein 1A